MTIFVKLPMSVQSQSVVKKISDGATTITPSQTLCYDIAYTAPDKGANHSYTNVTIVDVLDPRFEYVTSTGSSNFNNGSVSGNTVTWTAATLEDGATGSFQVCVKLKNGAATNGDIIPNQVTFNESGTPTATSGSPTITVSGILPNEIKLTKEITSGNGNAVLDEQVAYRIKVCNTGGVNNNNIVLTDNLPAGAVVAFADGGTVSGNTITWNNLGGSVLESGKCQERNIRIVFPSSAFSANDPLSKFANTAGFTGTPGSSGPVTYPPVTIGPIAVVAPVYKSDNFKYGSVDIGVGYKGYFEINITNSGNAALKNLVVADPIPPQINVTAIRGLLKDNVQVAVLKYKINGASTIFTLPASLMVSERTFLPVSSFLTNPTDYISELIWEYSVDFQPGENTNQYARPEYRYTVLANTHPYEVSGGTEVPAASVPVATPSSFTNTAFVTSSSLPSSSQTSHTTNVIDKFPSPDVNKALFKVKSISPKGRTYDISTTENVSPSDTVEYVLQITNQKGATDYLNKFTLTDVLPANVTYVPNSWQTIGASLVSTTNGVYNGVYPTSGAQIPIAFNGSCVEYILSFHELLGNFDGCNLSEYGGSRVVIPQPTFTQSGQSLSWSFDWEAWYNNYSGPNPAIGLFGGGNNDGTIAIKFKAVVKPTATTGASIANTFTLTTPQVPGTSFSAEPTQQTVLRKASLQSKKTVKGGLDTQFSSAGTTSQGGMADYCIKVFNNGNVPMKNIKIVDVLPYIGDIKVLSDVPRVNPGSSDWKPTLNAAIAAPAGITVQYSTVQKPCVSSITSMNANPMTDLGGCNPPNFSTTPPADLTTVQTLFFDFGAMVLAPGDSVKICWAMKAPQSAAVDKLAWNTFAYVADFNDGSNGGLLASEPPPVSLVIKADNTPKGSIGNYVFLDNGDNVQGTGDSPVRDLRVFLLNAAGIKIDSTSTAPDGTYLFSNLPLGTYSVQFVAPAGKIFVTPTQGADPTLDSDAGGSAGSPTYGTTAQVTLTVAVPNVMTLDAGLKNVPVIPKIYDLHLSKTIDNKTPAINGNVTYTIKLWNEGNAMAYNMKVKDTLNTGVVFQNSNANKGSYNSGTRLWSIDSLAVGDTATLKITAKVIGSGVFFNTAEITQLTDKTGTNVPDRDSTPANGVDKEDDLDRVCFSTPVELCTDQKLVANIPAQYTDVKWFRTFNGTTTEVGSGNSYDIIVQGSYTFSASSGLCPSGGCCAIIVKTVECCLPNICVPFVIKSNRKK